ncbi:MAG: isopentenyl phosphate kinase [Candidatus Thermoplasmatota archaeon]
MKLGGSVVTDKSSYRTPRLDSMARLASELAHAPQPLAIVHGAGSYGHVIAKEHELSGGDDGSAERRLAFAQVHADVRELTGLLLAALRDAGVPSVSHSTYDLARLDGGKLLSFHAPAIAETLRAGFVPVLSGDGVLDASRGFGVLSGDVLMVELAKAFRPERAVFATDVDGIFDRSPNVAGARLLTRIDAATEVAAGDAPLRPDVTGSMHGKLARAREVAKWGTPVTIVNGLAPGRVADALSGRDVIGTVVA